MIESVSPDGLRARAAIQREKGDESCARHLELAAERIERSDSNLSVGSGIAVAGVAFALALMFVALVYGMVVVGS